MDPIVRNENQKNSSKNSFSIWSHHFPSQEIYLSLSFLIYQPYTHAQNLYID